jgi:hypothetical protein
MQELCFEMDHDSFRLITLLSNYYRPSSIQWKTVKHNYVLNNKQTASCLGL